MERRDEWTMLGAPFTRLRQKKFFPFAFVRRRNLGTTHSLP
jgi:hypothetical protein